jgi:hypothetical protein
MRDHAAAKELATKGCFTQTFKHFLSRLKKVKLFLHLIKHYAVWRNGSRAPDILNLRTGRFTLAESHPVAIG